MPKFYHIEEVITSLCLRSGDLQLRNKGLYLDCSEDVFSDLNESVLKLSSRVKIPIRHIYNVDKKTNSINIPSRFLRISSVNAIDRYGCFHPIYRNDNLPTDIVDLGAQYCSCEFNCNSRLCHTVKGYEAITSVKSDYMPNGDPVSFTCVDKKMVQNGYLYSQTQYPQRVYNSGVWADTVLHTQDEKLCEVDVDDNGCLCDTEENLNNICTACGLVDASEIAYGGTSMEPPCEGVDTWIYRCASKMEWFNIQCGCYPTRCRNQFNNIYNITEDGERIIFPSNFGWGKVMIRGYEDISLQNLQIPYLAKECFSTGLQYYSVCHHDKKQQLAAIYGKKYTMQKWGLLLELNKLTLAEQQQTFFPTAIWPK